MNRWNNKHVRESFLYFPSPASFCVECEFFLFVPTLCSIPPRATIHKGKIILSTFV